MIIDKEKAIEDFTNFIDFPILGRALYLKMLQYKNLISENIDEFKNIVELRNLVKRNANEWPKVSNENEHEFEIVNTNGIWITILPDVKECEPSRVIPGKLRDYIVKEAAKMDFGIIKKLDNLIIPGIKGRLFNLWYEKIRDDYIYGIIKTTLIKRKSNYNLDVEGKLKELKNIDWEKMFDIFRLIFEDEQFMNDVYNVYKIWQTLLEENPPSSPAILNG